MIFDRPWFAIAMPRRNATAIMRRLMILAASSVPSMQAADSDAQTADEAGACLIVSEILRSEIVDSGNMIASLRDGRMVSIELDSGCPQLAFHGRYTYGATNGQLCAGRDYVIARSGEFCRILSIDPVAPEDSRRSED